MLIDPAATRTALEHPTPPHRGILGGNDGGCDGDDQQVSGSDIKPFVVADEQSSNRTRAICRTSCRNGHR